MTEEGNVAETSTIEWTDATFNPWIGCTKVSPACDHCYAEAMDFRFGGGHWGARAARKRTSVAYWRQPLAWNRKAEKTGRRPRVFCASLADVFDAEVPPEWRADLFGLIDATPHLDWLLLTKRPQIARKEMPATPRPNVWLGTTAETQAMADLRIPILLDTPAVVRFASIEPLLGPINLRNVGGGGWDLHDALTGYWEDDVDDVGSSTRWGHTERLDWVIVGGESGHGARPMHPGWARDLRDQCQAAGVPFFFKQWGEWNPAPEIIDASGSSFHRFGQNTWVQRRGKKAAGRLLDGRAWDELPTPSLRVAA